MSVPTNIKFKDFIKATGILAVRGGLVCDIDWRKSGSSVGLTFKKGSEIIALNVIHYENKEKKIYSDDLKKICKSLGVKKSDFDDLIKSKFK